MCVRVFVTYEDINVYNDTYDRYYKVKVIYEDISPYFKRLINHTE